MASDEKHILSVGDTVDTYLGTVKCVEVEIGCDGCLFEGTFYKGAKINCSDGVSGNRSEFLETPSILYNCSTYSRSEYGDNTEVIFIIV